MDFKERVFQARKAKCLSQEELAALVGVSRQAVSKWETGEAMPDTEKLIALCRALDRNMEYLALGKEATPPEKPSSGLKPWVTVLLAVVCLAAGFLLGCFLPERDNSADAAVDIRISNATITGTPGHLLEVGILPSVLPEGLQVELLCEDLLLCKTETVVCICDGNYYRAELSRPEKFRWRITAVLTCKNSKTQLPLWEIDGDGPVFSAIHLWEDAQ